VTGSRSRFTFEGIEPIEQRFLARAGHGAYIALKDRTDRKHEEGVGRVDLDAAQLTEFLTNTDDDELGLSGALGDDDPAEPGYDGDESASGGEHSPEQLMRAALRWVRATAIRNTSGDSRRHFRVRLFGPKGYSALEGGHFDCFDRSIDEQDDEPLPEIPPPDPGFAQNASMSKGLGALGEFYAQWGRIVLGSVGQIQGVNNNLLEKLHKQLQDARDQNDQLIAAILEARVAEIEAKEARAVNEHEGDARHALAKEALGQLGAAANTFLVSRGMSPEAVDVFRRLGSSSDLMSALQDPAVQELMKDEGNLRGLAEMLKQAGQQAQAAQAAANTTSDPHPEAEAS